MKMRRAVEDARDAHREGVVRHVLLAEEAVGGVAACNAVERDEPGAAVPRAARFVEGDVPGAADAEDSECRSAGRLDLLLVSGAQHSTSFGFQGAVRDVDVVHRDVDG